MNRTAALTLVALTATTVAAPAAIAGPKPKPITKTYTATAPMPDPTNVAGGYTVCAQTVPQSFHIEEFKVPAAGTLKVELTEYEVDWDLLIMDGKDKEIASSGSGGVGEPEIAQIKFKKAGLVQIVACNWSGGPTGTVTYTFTYK